MKVCLGPLELQFSLYSFYQLQRAMIGMCVAHYIDICAVRREESIPAFLEAEVVIEMFEICFGESHLFA